MEEQKSEEIVQDKVQDTASIVVERPTFLTVLCILTFIGSGLGILTSLLFVVGAGALMSFLSSIGGAAGAGGIGYFIVVLILSAASLFGAIQMWKLKKMGFYIYAGAGVLGMILPLLFGMGFSMFGAVITIAFIVMYYLNVKYMA